MSQRLKNIQASVVSLEKSPLQVIRQSSRFDLAQLRNIVYGEGNYQKYIRPVYDYICSNRHIFTHHSIQDKSIEQNRKAAARMSIAIMKQTKLNYNEDPIKPLYVNYALNAFEQGIAVKSQLHYSLYSKSLLLYGNNEVHKQFYERAVKLQDIGCFGLTEFYHGSYSKGIQTLATYDKETDDFVLTTQGTKGMKYWIGAASQFATVSVIWAQLIIDGVSQGPHPFILRLRCPKTHKVMNGIEIGDCGHKNGNNYIDNGYIIIKNVRVPRTYLLGKFGSVDSKGSYSSPFKDIDTRFGMHMSALSIGRAMISMAAHCNSINCLTIALRYSFSRKQFDTPDKKDEILIINYSLTRSRLIPQISQAIVQIIAGHSLVGSYADQAKIMKDSQFANELHGLSASLKARNTWSAVTSIQQSRTILGGHGYSAYSTISHKFQDAHVHVTWEGDNNMLLQQTSKYLIKILSKKDKKTTILDLSFVQQKSKVNLQDVQPQKLRKISFLLDLMKEYFRIKFLDAQAKLAELKSLYTKSEQVWYYFHPEAGNSLALAYADLYIFIQNASLSQARSAQVRDYLTKSLILWTLTTLERQRFGNVDLRKTIQKQIVKLCDELVEGSVLAMDAIAPPSYVIGSPFAEPNGNGFKQYINLLFSAKDTFARIPYHQDFIKMRNHTS